MHIPDGYLSPGTCATLFAGAAPFWYVAFRKLKRALHTRVVPMISVFAAFSFVVMMFNLPLPGGTTGHASGVAIASIVLGPWASILAISTALTVQAFFFGDGGITALGANCFNMAIAASVVASVVYKLAGGASASSAPRRRVFAAGMAGYISINAAALLAAAEMGVQPRWFHDAAGSPLYAPYPLHIAIPAMMIGHLTIAGIAEMVLTAGVVAWLQQAEPALLGLSAPSQSDGLKRSIRPLWAAVAALMILTPLGILAAGVAWGEWSPESFSGPEARKKMAESSLSAEPPVVAPQGLRSLSSFWTAPIPHYAPSVIRSSQFGYLLSAMTGTGIIILLTLGVGRFLRRAP